jgi:hypothetical protein
MKKEQQEYIQRWIQRAEQDYHNLLQLHQKYCKLGGIWYNLHRMKQECILYRGKKL